MLAVSKAPKRSRLSPILGASVLLCVSACGSTGGSNGVPSTTTPHLSSVVVWDGLAFHLPAYFSFTPYGTKDPSLGGVFGPRATETTHGKCEPVTREGGTTIAVNSKPVKTVTRHWRPWTGNRTGMDMQVSGPIQGGETECLSGTESILWYRIVNQNIVLTVKAPGWGGNSLSLGNAIVRDITPSS